MIEIQISLTITVVVSSIAFFKLSCNVFIQLIDISVKKNSFAFYLLTKTIPAIRDGPWTCHIERTAKADMKYKATNQ